MAEEVDRLKKLLHEAEEDAKEQRKQKDAALSDLKHAESQIADLRQQLKEAEEEIVETGVHNFVQRANAQYQDVAGHVGLDDIPFYCCPWVEENCCSCLVKRLKLPPPPAELPEGYAQLRWEQIGPCDCCTYRSPGAPFIGCPCCRCLPDDYYCRQCTWCPHFFDAWENPCIVFGTIVTLAEREEPISILPCGKKGLITCCCICPFVVFGGYAPYSCVAAILTVVQQRLILETYKLKPDRKTQALNSPETVCCCYCCALWKHLQFLSEMTMFDPNSPFKGTEFSLEQLKQGIPDVVVNVVEEGVTKGKEALDEKMGKDVPGQQKDPSSPNAPGSMGHVEIEPSGVNLKEVHDESHDSEPVG